ncbi:hypothetical protein BYT27DRAFT_7162283 [Phlegmacium glaucopus]|nr:hypothetical protein BYT27DRAFT_7162283 [Phlegmacium glaucopus]
MVHRMFTLVVNHVDRFRGLVLTRPNWLLDIMKSSWHCFSTEKPVVLCLGLGSPSSSHVSRVQLAFLSEACQSLEVNPGDISIYDPVFTTEDHLLFEELNMKVLIETANKSAASYALNVPTICFMPHCDLDLYESLLQSNWNRAQLSNIFLIGNHLEMYLENKSKRALESGSPCLLQIAPLLDCRPLPASDSWPTAFNNISVHFLHSDFCWPTAARGFMSDR